ncbi:MAG: hypothetical protein HQM08_28730 [Candidatus Riflebacteria bacterium]|nr:hypothetical protein [Candidatus Riflebacteria bacterium]
MLLLIEPFSIAKAGNKDFEYEDAYWPSGITEVEDSYFRFSVADGATESSFSKIWAVQLVEAFGKGELNVGTFWADIGKQQPIWLRNVTSKPLPWYAEEKVHSGAFAAFMGLEISEDSTTGIITWKATGLGDCCIFQVGNRSDRSKKDLIVNFPFQSSSAFGNTPALISSVKVNNNSIEKDLLQTDGTALANDVFYLMTDAIACWFLKEVEEGLSPWETLEDLNTRDGTSFRDLIDELRQEKKLKNDDVTILKIVIGL